MPGNSKKSRKPYRPQNRAGGVKLRAMPWRAAAIFGPLEAILSQIETSGTVTTDAQGMPIFKDQNDGDWYATVPALEGVIDAFAAHQVRSGRVMPLDILRRFAKKLEYASPIALAECAEVRRDLATLRAETLAMTQDYAASLVRTTQIRIELDNRERVAA